MTIPNANRRVRYEGNGATTRFTFDFKAPQASDLLVVVTPPNGQEATLLLDVDYSVAGAGSDEGGFVTYPLSGTPLPTGSFLTILRNLPFTQTLDIANQGPWLPEVIEAALDRLTILTQQLLEQNDRSLRHSVGSGASGATLPSPNGAALLGYSAEGHLVTHPLATETLPRETLYVSGADATPGYLADKLAVGAGLAVDTLNPGGFESLVLSCPLAGRVSVDDETPGFLHGKIVAGSGMSLTLGGSEGDERLVVASLGKALSSATDETFGHLAEKIEGGPGVAVDTHSVDGDVKTRLTVNGGGLRRVTTFTASGEYAKPDWLKHAVVHVVGSGAGGYYGGGGGGAGGCARKFLAAADIGATVQVTVGGGGSAGTSGDHDGSAGAQSSFGSHCSASGGAVGTSASGGAGGTGSGGDINLPGEAGGNEILSATAGSEGVAFTIGGRGGAARGEFGGGSANPGAAGLNYGGGGGGGSLSTSGVVSNGGAGAGGLVVVEEYSL